ncbi:TA system antitoxin ParD family protein [Bdellovibrio sp. HCB185ZH]|uniref:TA system antitoxin ParD family protein n=1 Tax=Bdellovibrio sp. HCB185ZH TaxID=3394235 RepID=UPI0039A771BB
MKTGIKIQSTLLTEAKKIGDQENRSATAQIEHWILLGKAQDEKKKLSLKRFESSLSHALSKDFNKTVDTYLFNNFEYVYVASARGDKYIDRLSKNGQRETGTIEDGEFRKCD